MQLNSHMRVLRQPFYIRYQKDIVYHQYNISSYVPEKSMYSNRCCDREFDHLISVNLRINLPLVMIFSNLLVVYLKQFLNNFFLTRLTYEYQFKWKTSKKTISSFFFSVNKFLLNEFGKILFSILSQEENLSRFGKILL